MWKLSVAIAAAYGLQSVRAASHSIPMSSPPITEQHSSTWNKEIVTDLKCDACAAIAFQLHKKFREAERLSGKGSVTPLSDSAIIDSVDSVCAKDTFQGYGTKMRDGHEHLHGAGLDPYLMGLSFGGGMWPDRMTIQCARWTGDDYGPEEDFYHNVYRKGKGHVDDGISDGVISFSEALCVDRAKFCDRKTLQAATVPEFRDKEIKKNFESYTESAEGQRAKKRKERKEARKKGKKKGRKRKKGPMIGSLPPDL